ncbi:hypothetical protein SADUNF_Sadunf11G0120500 [Salix dunnii]|uniref:Uncharacterized protein n=1 Tax=Salix dunnii TaxID=1413687 RepID=A0A835JMV3_9ROSI|nr:hypothetical protein SADUNF_Sadunf11G0120500 [Salix dunnii]
MEIRLGQDPQGPNRGTLGTDKKGDKAQLFLTLAEAQGISVSFLVSKSSFLYILLPFCIQFLHVSSWFIRSERLLGLLTAEGGFEEDVQLGLEGKW